MSFVFPFALAHTAVTEMEELAARVRSLVNVHDAAVVTAEVDFEGETRVRFDRDLAQQMDMLQSFARMLDGDAGSLRSTIASAQWLAALDEANNP